MVRGSFCFAGCPLGWVTTVDLRPPTDSSLERTRGERPASAADAAPQTRPRRTSMSSSSTSIGTGRVALRRGLGTVGRLLERVGRRRDRDGLPPARGLLGGRGGMRVLAGRRSRSGAAAVRGGRCGGGDAVAGFLEAALLQPLGLARRLLLERRHAQPDDRADERQEGDADTQPLEDVGDRQDEGDRDGDEGREEEDPSRTAKRHLSGGLVRYQLDERNRVRRRQRRSAPAGAQRRADAGVLDDDLGPGAVAGSRDRRAASASIVVGSGERRSRTRIASLNLSTDRAVARCSRRRTQCWRGRPPRSPR